MNENEKQEIGNILKKQSHDFIIDYNIWYKDAGHNASFDDIIKMWQALGVKVIDNAEITKENIPLFYKFMSDEDMLNHSRMIDDLFENRLEEISSKIEFDENKHNQTSIDTEHSFIIAGQEFFGVKDILKPIDEYIAEIRESQEYQQYENSSVSSEVPIEQILAEQEAEQAANKSAGLKLQS